MDIKNSAVNFKANKILTTSKILSNNTERKIDVFQLKFGTDDYFIKSCSDIIKNNKKLVNKKHQNLNLFFKDFLNKKTREGDYFIAIRDGEQIVGAAKTYQHYFSPITTIEKFINLNNDNKTTYALNKSILNKAKKHRSRIIGWEDNKIGYIMNDDSQIAKLLPPKKQKIKFSAPQKPEEVNLLDFLDIDI